MAENDWAILVGVSKYPYLNNLEGPENDVVRFYEWLRDPLGGAVPDDQIIRIVSSHYQPAAQGWDAKPTVEAFKQAIDHLVDIGLNNEYRVGRRLYLYFAGHGFSPTINESALLMANAAKHCPGHHIPARAYADWFRESAFFDEIVMFADCCRDNYASSLVHPCHLEPINGRRETKYFYGFASQWSIPAREGRVEGFDQVCGLFSIAITESLKRASGTHGKLSSNDLKQFVGRWLANYAPEDSQSPEFLPGNDSPPIWFAGLPMPVFRLTISVRGAGTELPEIALMRGDSFASVIRPTWEDGKTWEWELESRGLYRYRVGDSDHFEPIEIIADQRVEVVVEDEELADVES